MLPTSNFGFLSVHDAQLCQLGARAEPSEMRSRTCESVLQKARMLPVARVGKPKNTPALVRAPKTD